MKKRLLSISILSIVLILSSCQKIKDVFTVKVDTSFSVNLPVNTGTSPLKSTDGVFSSTQTFDPLSNEDLATYKDKIKGFLVTDMFGTVTQLSEPVTLSDVTLEVSTGSVSTSWHMTNLELVEGTVVQFDNLSDQWTKLDEIMGAQTVITVVLSGTSNKSNVTFTFVVKFDTQVSAKIL